MTNFPVKIAQNAADKYKSILEKEGDKIIVQGQIKGVVVGASPVSFGSAVNFNGSNILVDVEYEVWSDKTCRYSGSIYDSFVTARDSVFSSCVLISGIKIKSKIPKIGANFNLGSLYEGDGTAYNGGAWGSGTLMTNDLNFNADKVIWWIGDSISQPTVNANVTNDKMTQFMVRDWINEQSIVDYRISIRAYGGRTTRSYETLRANGQMIIDQADIIFYQLGMNDKGSQGNESIIPLNEYTVNINNFIKHKKRFYKDSYLIFLGNTPIQKDYDNNLSVAYRNAMQNCVTVANDPNIIYLSLEKSFDRTIFANYATSDTNGSAVHPGSISSQLAIFNCIINGQNFDGTTQTGIKDLIASGVIKL